VSFGVYVHIPFCTRRCDYCAFATWTDRFHLVERYIDACVIEAGNLTREATSVYFGGGTPSLLDPAQLQRVLGAIPRSAGAEVTVECNPDTVDAAKLAGYRQAGVNRLSFGLQSMAPHVLAGLGRQHDPEEIRRAVDAAASTGYGDRYSVDLIYGAAGESLGDWEATLRSVLALDPAPAHVSAYALTVEAGTPLASVPARHPDPDDQADKYLIADRFLAEAGRVWYEISNWSLPGRECRHNRLYWDQGEYIGIGCAAHSHLVDTRRGTSRRWWNVRHLERYLAAIETRGGAEAGSETLDPAARDMERLELELRTRRGVPAASLPGWRDDPGLNELLEEAPDERVRLTRRGRLLANEVALRLTRPSGTGDDETPGDDHQGHEETYAGEHGEYGVHVGTGPLGRQGQGRG
jgi:oxygen-independent coproporphyrinogen-3 oxidase